MRRGGTGQVSLRDGDAKEGRKEGSSSSGDEETGGRLARGCPCLSSLERSVHSSRQKKRRERKTEAEGGNGRLNHVYCIRISYSYSVNAVNAPRTYLSELVRACIISCDCAGAYCAPPCPHCAPRSCLSKLAASTDGATIKDIHTVLPFRRGPLVSALRRALDSPRPENRIN